jgi:hypothetical protein
LHSEHPLRRAAVLTTLTILNGFLAAARRGPEPQRCATGFRIAWGNHADPYQAIKLNPDLNCGTTLRIKLFHIRQ